MPENMTYLFDPTPYSTPAKGRRRPYRDPAVAAAIKRVGATLAQLSPEEQTRRQVRAAAMGVMRQRR